MLLTFENFWQRVTHKNLQEATRFLHEQAKIRSRRKRKYIRCLAMVEILRSQRDSKWIIGNLIPAFELTLALVNL